MLDVWQYFMLAAGVLYMSSLFAKSYRWRQGLLLSGLALNVIVIVKWRDEFQVLPNSWISFAPFILLIGWWAYLIIKLRRKRKP